MAYVQRAVDDDPSGPLQLPSGGKQYVDALLAFEGNGHFNTDGHVSVAIPGFSAGEPVTLGSSYSAYWANEWTIVVTIGDAGGASPALDPPNTLFPEPAVNLSAVCVPTHLDDGQGYRGCTREGGSEQLISMKGIEQASQYGAFFGSNVYWWDGYDDGKLRDDHMFDTPSSLCDATRGSDARECEFARFLYVPPVSTDVTITAVGLLPILDGSTTVRLRDGVRMRNVGGTSPAASTSTLLPVGGSFGSFAAPRITSVLVNDPDNSSPLYSDGDTITITFDVPLSVTYRNWRTGGIGSNPNARGYDAAGVSGPRAFVNSLFVVSGKLGQDYSGLWADSSTFVIAVTDVTASYGIDIGATTVQVLPCPQYTAFMCGDVTNAARTSPPSADIGVLRGTFGAVTGPRVHRFEAVDPDEGDNIYGVGDQFHLHFSMDTNRALDQGGISYLESLFAFSFPGEDLRTPALPSRVGDELRASWVDSSTLEITVEASAVPEWPVQFGTTLEVVGDVYSPQLNAPASRTRATLPQPIFPRIVSFVAEDADSADDILSAGDTFKVTFDARARPDEGLCLSGVTWPCAASGGRRLVDELFDFSTPIGFDYSGAWLTDFAFQITILDPTGEQVAVAPRFGDSNDRFIGFEGRPPSQPQQLPSLTPSSAPLLYAPPRLPPAILPPASNASVSPIAPPRDLPPVSPEATLAPSPSLQHSMGAIPTRVSVTCWLLIGFPAPVIGSASRFVVGLDGREHITTAYAGALPYDTTVANLTGSVGFLDAPSIASYFTRPFTRPATRPTRMSGAELLLLFDAPTDYGGRTPPASLGNSQASLALSHADLTAMLDFTPSIGQRLTGAWLSPSALHIVVADAGTLRAQNASVAKPTPPATWTCSEVTYGTGDGCDCGCGALDPDCADAVERWHSAWNCDAGQVCVAPGICSGLPTAVRLRGASTTGAAVRTAAGRSLPSQSRTPLVSGRAQIPAIAAFVAADPSNGDSVVSAGDTLTVHFSATTNFAAGALRGNRSFVDDIFRFSPDAIGADYSGEWADASTFVVTLVDAAGSLAAIGDTSVSLRQDGRDTDGDGVAQDIDNEGSVFLANAAERLASLQHSVPLSGSFGDAHATSTSVDGHVPGVVQLVFRDTTKFGPRPTWSVGDTLRVVFDSAVNVKPGWPVAGSRDFVDALFQFSHSLGESYSGYWLDGSIFVVDVLTPAAAAPPLNGTAPVAATVRVIGNVRNAAGNGPSAAVEGVPQVLTGDFGSFAAPEPLSVTARDPDNSALGYGPGDTLDLVFSLPTNRDMSTSSSTYVDSLFSFDPPIGDVYSGTWKDDSTFLITVSSVGDAAPAIGSATATVTGNIRDEHYARPAAVGQQAALSGSYGSARAPALVMFVADGAFLPEIPTGPQSRTRP